MGRSDELISKMSLFLGGLTVLDTKISKISKETFCQNLQDRTTGTPGRAEKRASDPSLRSVNRPTGPWLSTHDEATRVLWGGLFFKDSLPFLDSL